MSLKWSGVMEIGIWLFWLMLAVYLSSRNPWRGPVIIEGVDVVEVCLYLIMLTPFLAMVLVIYGRLLR